MNKQQSPLAIINQINYWNGLHSPFYTKAWGFFVLGSFLVWLKYTTGQTIKHLNLINIDKSKPFVKSF